MFGLIWTVIVIYVCYHIYKQRTGNQSENNQGGQTQNPQGQIPTRPGYRPVYKPMQTKPLVQQPPVKQMPKAKEKQQTAEEQTRGKDGQESTLAYLEEKARQDAIEHEMEKREEARRLYESSGGLRPAQRLYEGESVPNGCKCIVCGYCGAENLIPMMARERFSCYFCREPLAEK